MMNAPASPVFRKPAFTLVELLAVMAVMAIFLAFAIPAMNGMLAGLNIHQGGQAFADQILLGRQNALSRNHDVEVRFVDLGSGGLESYRGMQIWMVDETGTRHFPISRTLALPDGVVINANFSPLVFGDGATVSGQTNFGAWGTCQYRGFRFRANGQTDIPTGSGTNSVNYFTLQNAADSSSRPRNFFTIQINPLTGKLNVLRP